MRFDELDLDDAVLDGLEAMNFVETTPIQELAIPPILAGKDLIGCAQTGTGKTAAYVLPIISQLSRGGYPQDAINAVIMAPTRELAKQIDQQIDEYLRRRSDVTVLRIDPALRKDPAAFSSRARYE